jgi:hypothetical protein
VPELATDDQWLEAPFWVWSSNDPVRRPLFVRALTGEIRLSDRRRWEVGLPLTPDGEGEKAVQRWMQFPAAGVKIRSRALVTTLWARLALGDLFLHGIGGAKYDQVTDVLIERFFGLKAPGFLVVSATLLLPGARSFVDGDELLAIDRDLRELTWHPERSIDRRSSAEDAPAGSSDRQLAELLAEKERWIGAVKTPENGRERHWAIRRINDALQLWVADRRRSLEDRREEIRRSVRAEGVRSWREYGFPFYPADLLRESLLGLLPGGE